MDPLVLGALLGAITIAVLFSGVSVAVGLLIVSTGFLLVFDGLRSLQLLPEIFFSKLDSFELLSIPMFIIMGAAIASTRAGADLYESLERWLTRVPGGLVISNLGACALFAAMSGSSPATCAAIGKMGIPEMRRRGYPDGVAAGSIAAGGTLGILIPPSVTMIVYGIATETSIGRLFLAGILPGILLATMFLIYVIGAAIFWPDATGEERMKNLSDADRLAMDAQAGNHPEPGSLTVLTSFAGIGFIVAGVLGGIWFGVFTPTEGAGAGAALALLFAIAKGMRLAQLQAAIFSVGKTAAPILILLLMAALYSRLFPQFRPFALCHPGADGVCLVHSRHGD